jgi:predicted aspartyl protease
MQFKSGQEMAMRINEENGVSRFFVEIELANNDDLAAARRGTLDAGEVRRVKLQGLVDSGAGRLVLPKKIAKKLGLESTGKVKVRYAANGATATRPLVEGVYLELMGRHGLFSATVEPKRETALVGAIVLEELDFLVDCRKGRLYPRDPRFVVSEAE